MSTRKNRTLTVIRKNHLSKNMLRIELGGDDLKDFPECQEGGYIKLLFSPTDNTALNAPLDNLQKPIMRTYTIRKFDTEALKITLDFIAHGESGPASAWAANSQVGDNIIINGPGAPKLVDMSADWFFIAGDMTALPAISVNVEKLPAHARGYTVIEVLSAENIYPIDAPENMDIIWVINPQPDTLNTLLADKVKSLPWLDGTPNIWVASEFETMRNLRRYFKQERNVERDQIYASSYWKMGETDEGNKAAKKMDNEA